MRIHSHVKKRERPANIGLVLSGGAVRGAYEVGVIQGILEILKPRSTDLPVFSVFSGTSVGALNCTFLAAHSDLPDFNIQGLRDIWTSFKIENDLKMDPWALLSAYRFRKGRTPKSEVRTLLDGSSVNQLVRTKIPYERLHKNIQANRIRGLAVSALEVDSGRTHIFVEQSKEGAFIQSRDPRRVGSITTIEAEHVLASAAIPFLYPAQKIGNAYFCDGGLRFNTPVAPAIRLGADKLLVVALGHLPTEQELAERKSSAEYPSIFFLLGKILDALLLDSLPYDLQILERFNKLLTQIENTMSNEDLERFHKVVSETRGQPYRKIGALMFAPSQDMGVIAGRYVRRHHDAWDISWLTRKILESSADVEGMDEVEADLASYILFDGGYTEQIIELGRHDAHEKAEELIAFFNDRTTTDLGLLT